MDKYLQDIVRDKRYWESKRQNIRQQEKKLEDITARYEQDLEAVNKQRKEIMRNAKEEAQRILSEANAKIENTIRENGMVHDPIVIIQFADVKFSVLGEVARPGQFSITKDRISLFDALAMAGDLTIYGIRTDVAVAREVDGVRTIEYLDLTSKDLFNSPAFYIQQNDVIYVKPNKYKAQAGEISQNRNFYLSLVGTAISVATLIITLTK